MNLNADKPLHKLLDRQFKKSGMVVDDLSPECNLVFNFVNNSFYDVDNERKLNQRAIEISQKELEDVNLELQSKNDFLDSFNHGLAHDIKNHTSNITGLLSMLRKYQAKNNTVMIDKIVDKLDLSTNQLTSIVQGFLYLSRAEDKIDSQFRIIDKDELIDAIKIETLFLAQGKNIDINYNISLNDLFYSRHILKIILVNLVSNSIKFNRIDAESFINITLSHTNNLITLCVEDNGIGMDLTNPENKVFKLFDQQNLSSQKKGTGVGLFVVKKIIERNHGNVNVSSQLNLGTKFTITLPINFI